MALVSGTVGPFNRVQIARYAGAVRDFNPIHVDEDFAINQAGLPSVVAHGPLVMTLTFDRILAALGSAAVVSFEARLKAMTLPGDVLSVEVADDGAVTVTKPDGSVVIDGRIVFAPSTDSA